MIAPEKYREEWAEYLSEKAFTSRVTKANTRLASASSRPSNSMAGKWLRYYSHDSGKSRFIIQDRPAEPYHPGHKSGDDAFVQLQQLGVGELIWEKTCPHTDETTETEERSRRKWNESAQTYEPESYRVAVTTCPRCKRTKTVNLSDVKDDILEALDEALVA